ncbi:unnamed protein product [Caenorhabditis bovis]|uniref:TNFR-Cys domain-containing protein n=1 Tax=Caenorhabditis bovis TaxID=2654633 RepID=A0A8S1EBX4_9PELO|nr:unnamed protein product [Caenorhabditis bovis]
MLDMSQSFLFAVFLLISCNVQPGFSAPPACAAGVTCPPGGFWSEWAYSGNDTDCATPCGSCSTRLQTRYCLSDHLNCKCSGASSREVPCNMDVCMSPAQRSCCIPYVAMAIDGKFQCGPFAAKTEAQCCPVGGLWSEWSSYGRNDARTAYIRTRHCLSESSGCPCKGADIENSTKCPCKTLANEITCGNSEIQPYNYPVFDINDEDCVGEAMFERSDATGIAYCSKINGTLLAAYAFKTPDGKCLYDHAHLCVFYSSRYRQIFTCDLDTLEWRYDHTSDHITSYNQYIYRNPDLC